MASQEAAITDKTPVNAKFAEPRAVPDALLKVYQSAG
jgi:hypothetical protein